MTHLLSNKPTHYLIDYGDFITNDYTGKYNELVAQLNEQQQCVCEKGDRVNNVNKIPKQQ